MNPKKRILEQTFGHTTVNLAALELYLRSDPGYLVSAIECGDDEFNQTIANHADYVEFWLRRYVAGADKTLHRLFVEVQAFLDFDEPEARLVIPVLFEKSVRQTLMDNEWYEWLPRYELARQRIQRRFAIEISR